MQANLGPIDYAIMLIYVAFVIGIGWTLRRYMKTSSDFLTSGRSIPAWVTGLAFISRQPRRPRTGRHGRQRRQVRHRHQPLLLGRRHSRDDLPGDLHDAVLLRLQGPLGARVPQDAVRRARPLPELHHLRRDDGLRLRHLHERPGQAAPSASRLGLQPEPVDLLGGRAGLRAQGRPDLGHLHRSAPVLHDRAGLCPGGLPGPQGRRRLER